MRLLDFVGLFVVLNLTCQLATAQQAGEAQVRVLFRDGTSLVGHILTQDDLRLRLLASSGEEIDVPLDGVRSIRATAAETTHDDEAPEESRLMLMPTGRPLSKGEGYLSSIEVFVPGLSYGITNNVSFSAGFSAIPTLEPEWQIYYAVPKVGARLSARDSASVGMLLLHTPAWDGPDTTLVAPFAAVTHVQRPISLSVALGSAPGTQSTPHNLTIAMIGGTVRLGPHAALVAEKWLAVGADGSDRAERWSLLRSGGYPMLGGASLRLTGGRFAVDLGIMERRPWLSVTCRLGP